MKYLTLIQQKQEVISVFSYKQKPLLKRKTVN